MKAIFLKIRNFARIPVVMGMLAMVAACDNDSIMPDIPEVPEFVGDSITVSGTINIPVMPQVVGRGALGETPAANLKLTILEFDWSENAANNFLTNIYQAEVTTTTAVGSEATVTFKVTLKSATTPKVLHLLVADNYVSTEHGSEATILPAVSVSGNSEAYWGKVVFKDGYNTLDANDTPVKIPGLEKKLQEVPLIRNFAKITVTENLADFELLGFELVNVPTSGTIAPWNQSTLSVPELLDGSSMKGYSTITDDVKYHGIIPGATQFRNTEAEAKNWVDGTNSPLRSQVARYVYEHPYESTRRTYLIINGIYNGTQGFYKVDIGNIADDGTFNYYNIIRNIQYNIVITSVNAVGTETVAEAIARAPFNNLMAATETSTMLNVSDGDNMLIVNDTNHIIVDENQTIDILYRYITDVTGAKNEDNTVPHPVGLEPGEVIKSVGPQQTYTDAAGAHWVKYTITPNTPTTDVKTQDFSIIDGNGLGRIIHLVLRTPWQYAPIMVGNTSYSATIAPGHNNSYQGAPQVISAQAGQELTVYFDLPDGLPESMFPLEFQLEAKNQGVENNKIGTLLVSTGPSLFDPSKIAISYIKTLSYSEYCYNYVATDDSNDVDINSPNTKHTVRCRFLTITAVNDANAEIMIYNPYFSPNASVQFTRQ